MVYSPARTAPYAPAMTSFGSLALVDFLRALASKTPTPGGGAAASAVGSLAASLAQMVVSYSVGKKSLVQHEAILHDAAQRLENARGLLLGLADEDAQAYGVVNELMKLPPTDPRRIAEEPAAVLASAQIPLATAAACVDLLRLFTEISGKSNRQLRSDLGIAAVLADACVRASAWNVRINLAGMPEGGPRAQITRELELLLDRSSVLAAEVQRACAV